MPVSPRRLMSLAAGLAAGLIVSSLLAAVAPSAAAMVAAQALEVGARPDATRVDFPVGDRVDASVDVGTGNLLVTTTDLTLPGISRDVQLGLDYNSLLLGSSSPLPSGSPGAGWAMRLGQDTKLIANTDGSVLYLAPGGREGLYTPVTGGGYTSPAGFKNTLVTVVGGGWTLTEHASNAKTSFDSAGRLSKVTDRNGQATTLTYVSGVLAKIVSTRGTLTQRTANVSITGGSLTSIAQTGSDYTTRTVSYGYVSGPNVVTITDAGSRVTRFGYTGGALTSITNTGGVATTFAYDTGHRVISVTRDNPGGQAATTRFAYPFAATTQLAGPNTDQGSPVASVPHTTYTLNTNKRVNKAVDPLGHTRQATYTPFLDVATATNGVSGVSSFGYTANGGESLTNASAPTGASATASYGNTGTAQFLPSGGTDTQANTATYSYDGSGNPLSSANGGTAATAKVTYNADGTLSTSTDPANGTTSYTVDSATHQLTNITPPAGSSLGAQALTYDAFGRLGTSTDGRGIITSYGYDLLDRATSQSYSDATHAVTYSYDSAGNVKTRTDASGTTTYGYDGLNRLTSRQASSGGGTITYGYDKAGNLTSSADARGSSSYGYDDANQQTSMTNASGQLLDFAYNNDGKRTDTWYATNTANTVWAAHSHTDFDTSGRVARAWTGQNSADATRIFDTSYCHSAFVAGQPCPTGTAGTDKGVIKYTVNNLTGVRSDYTYDQANRLTDVTNFNGHTYHYGYDIDGNRSAVTVDGATTQTRTFNSANQVSSAGYTYDGAGNLTGDPTAGTLAYNGAGQLTGQSGNLTGTYSYAGADQTELIHQTVPGGTAFDYVYGRNDTNKQPVLESFAKNNNLYYLDHDGTGTPLVLHLPSGPNDFYVLDGQGSVVALINAAGATAATYTYDPYGTQTGTTGTGDAVGANPLRFTGGLYDRGTGWTKYGVRYDDTTLGRFTSQDPLTRLLDPDNANRYAYAADNPTNDVDPTGRDFWGTAFTLYAYSELGGFTVGTAALAVAGGVLVGGPVAITVGVLAGAAIVAGGAFTIYEEVSNE